MGRCNINTRLLPVKAHYFLINGAHSAVIPFIAVYAKQMGISSDAIGYIFAIICCVTLVSRPILGGLVDHLQKMKIVLISLILVDVVAGLGLNFIPSPIQVAERSPQCSLLCHENGPYLLQFKSDLCQKNLSESVCTEDCVVSCFHCHTYNGLCRAVLNTTESFSQKRIEDGSQLSLNCTDMLFTRCHDNTTHANMSCGEMGRNTIEPVNPLFQLTMLAVFTAVLYICLGSIVSLSDAACFNTLCNKPELYGRQRLWGTVGWGSFALLVGYLNQAFTGTSKTYNFSPGFYMLVALFLIDLFVVPKLELKTVKVSKNICKDVGLLVLKPRIVLFIVQVFSIGVFIGISRTYVFWHLRTLNASQLVLGSATAVQCFLGELPFFLLAGRIITKLGHVNVFTMSFVAHGVRFLSYSFLIDPWWVLPIEILQGPCFGSFYSAMTSYAKLIAPVGTEATVQGLAGGTFEGLGVAAGSLLGGYGFRTLGGRATFFWAGIISFVVGIFHCSLNALLTCNSRSVSRIV